MRAAALAGLVLWAGVGDAQDLRIAVQPNFPPFIALDAGGDLTGFDKALGDEICARAEVSCAWVVTEFDALIPGVASGAYDMAMSGLGASAARREIVDFSDIYLPSSNPAAFVGRPDAPAPETARIGVQTGTIHEETLRAQGLAYSGYDSIAQALDAAQADQVDLVFGSSSYFQSALARTHPSLRILGLADVGVEGSAIAIAKGRDDLRRTLNAAITDMRQDGTIEALVQTWFAPRSDL